MIEKKINELSIIIPAHNEEAKIELCVNEIIKFCLEQKLDYEIIISEDGSIDNTLKIINNFAKDNPRIIVLTSNEKLGKGKAVQNGMLNATKQYIGFMDADMSAHPKELLRFFDYMPKYDIVIGSRILRGDLGKIDRPFSRMLFSHFYSILFQILFNTPIKDAQCGFKLFKKDIISELFLKTQISGFAFDTEIIVLAFKKNLKIKEVPIQWSHDNVSKVNVLREIYLMGRDILKIRFKS